MLLVITIGVVSCRHEAVIPDSMILPSQSSDCDADTVYFVNTIQPLLNSTCATSGCHDEATHKHGVILTTYTRIIQTGEIRPGRPEDSKVYEVLGSGKDEMMPPSPQSPLSTEQRKLIYDWIKQGAKNNECLECNTETVSFAADISGIIANNCASCHSGTSPNGGVRLTNYTEISSVAQSGRLQNVITASNGAPQMPPSGPMSNCNIDKITKWIQDGYPNN